VDNFFSFQITATNGPLTAYAATNLPAGLTLDAATGLISGFSAAGTYNNVGLAAWNAIGPSATVFIQINISNVAYPPAPGASLDQCLLMTPLLLS